jgi:cell division transport system permease protein
MAAVNSPNVLHAPPSSGRFRNWLIRHASTGAAAFSRLARQPFASFMIILVIAVTLALPTAMHLVIKNAQSISASWDNALDFSVYLNSDTSIEAARRLADIIRQRADVEQVTLITSAEALEEFRQQSGFGESLDHLTVNPLPHTLVVRPGTNHTEVSMNLLNEELGNLPETDFVQVDTEWVRRFHAILDILQRSIAIGAALLGAAIIIIIGNTIRLDIQNRREEIEVTKLIGASSAFVRRPFLYSGLWYGLGGGR